MRASNDIQFHQMGLFESNYYVACTKKAFLQSFELKLEFVKPMLGFSRTSEVHSHCCNLKDPLEYRVQINNPSHNRTMVS